MYEIHILFKNGSEIFINCDDFKVTRRDDDKIEKINYTKGKENNTLLYIDLDEILCIYSK